MPSYHNISGEVTQQLIGAASERPIKSISLANVHADTPCTVDLYIQKQGTGIFYLLKNTLLPIGATLIYDEATFSTRSGEFGLFVKLTKSASETPVVDVIIN
tara:strand:+ start:207 stop:512 length:306 start_codon:yes stop_codon:yes gene_type:complete